MKRRLESAWLGQFPLWALLAALLLAIAPAYGAPEFLEPEQAFRLGIAERGDGQVQLRWEIAPGYYLYRDRIEVTGQGAGVIAKPRGESKEDPNFGTVEVYHDAAEVQVAAGTARALQVTWQGCADEGLCYPPQQQTVALAAAASAPPPAAPAAAAAPGSIASTALALGSDSEISRMLAGRSLAWTLPLFFALGIALAFTPCVLPMVPILSSMVVGSGASPRRGLFLSLAFVLPMAATYAALGVLAAVAGSGLQAWMQNPWTLLAFSAVFVALAAAMFGFYELQLPAFLRDRLARKSLQGGSLAGAAGMGVLSAVLVGPCMTAPLAGTLLYIAQGGSAGEGGLLLLALGLGMGVPLVVISTLGARWLPRPGAWMDRVKAAFGFVLLGTAIWMAGRVLAPQATLLLWGVLLVALALSLWQLARGSAAGEALPAGRLAVRSSAALAGLWGAAMVLGAAAGASDPAQPLRALVATSAAATPPQVPFETLQDPAMLQARLAEAAARGQPAVVEFSADWCTSCKTIEREVFGDPRVGRALEGVLLLRADVTRSDAAQRAFMQRHQVMGPPTLMLFGPQGQERREQRLVGEFAPDALLERLRKEGGPS
ncbi:MAG: protein-disulfide reductase DsbD [Comamonadaceae bacterium]|nr:MAG: protein-disulfide reductase DsbD [Comamonadaceae bacterium]